MKTKTLSQASILTLFTITSAIPLHAAELQISTVIGVDFGAADGTSAANNWNDVTSGAAGSFTPGTMIDTSGVVVDGVAFSWTAGTSDSAAPDIITGVPAFPNNALDDALLARDGELEIGGVGNSDGTFTLTFTGLDDSLYYDITLGQSNTATNGNTDTAWTVVGATLNSSPVADGMSAYVTFSSVESSGGQIVITSEPIAGGLDISAISALQLTATDVPPPPPPSPAPLGEGVALNFDPQVGDDSVVVGDLNTQTLGGTWTTGLSGLSRFEANTGGYAYIIDAADSQGDFIEVTLDGGGLDFGSSEIAIGFQMLASQASVSADNSATLIGFDGSTEIFRLSYQSHTDNTLNTVTLTTSDGDETLGSTPLKWINSGTLPSGFQDFRIVLSNGLVSASGSSLATQDGVALNATQTLTSLRWEITGASTAQQGFWLDDLIVWDTPPAAPRAATDRPNVIFILMDDMGYKDVSCYGATDLDTPNIDALASGGLRFTDFHTGSSICSPSRAAFLTGAYPQRCGLPYGISPNRESHWFLGLNPDEITLAEQCQKQGYKTLMIGKWHLGFEDKFSYYNQGFENYYGCTANMSHDPRFYDERELIFSNTPRARLNSLYTQRIREHVRKHRDRPFFLYYSHQYPHTPYQEGNAFDGATGNGTRADALKEVDWSIGQLVAELEANGILENTLLVFTSDNGATANTYCLPWKGTKYVTWEGGHRVPFILNWKGQIQTPAVLDTQTVAMDLFPTVSDVIGEPLPTDRVYDGVSLTSLMAGQPLARAADTPFYYYNNKNLQAVRKGDWKLHLPRTAEQRPWWDSQPANTNFRLFNLATDVREDNNVYADPANATIANELTALAESIRLELGEYMIQGNSQRATGTLFPEVPIFQNLDDWDSLLSDAEKGRGKTEYNFSGVSASQSFLSGSTLPAGWQYLYASEASGGVEVSLTPGASVGTQGNIGFIGTGATPAALIGDASTGTFVIDLANTANAAVAGTDLLVFPDEDPSRDHIIVRYTVSDRDVFAGKTRATISGSFRDLVGGTTDDSVAVHVFLNTTELFAATGSSGRLLEVDGAFTLEDVSVAEGDTISFVVGSKGSQEGDEVALSTLINFTAEESPNGEFSLNIPSGGVSTFSSVADLKLLATPGLSYRIESSVDLNNWEVVDEITFLPTSPYDLYLEAPYTRMFYRVVWEE